MSLNAKTEINAQGRYKYEMNDEATFWLAPHEFNFIKFLKEWEDVFVWNQDEKVSMFPDLKSQNSFIKRMLKYGVLLTDYKSRDGNYPSAVEVYLHSLNRPKKLHMQSGHNVEHWIRDNWDKYSTETMEVVTVKGIFDTPDHHRMFVAHNNELHSYTINADTDRTVFETLNIIEKELGL